MARAGLAAPMLILVFNPISIILATLNSRGSNGTPVKYHRLGLWGFGEARPGHKMAQYQQKKWKEVLACLRFYVSHCLPTGVGTGGIRSAVLLWRPVEIILFRGISKTICSSAISYQVSDWVIAKFSMIKGNISATTEWIAMTFSFVTLWVHKVLFIKKHVLL